MSNYYKYIEHPVSGKKVKAAFIDFGDHYKVQVLAEPYGVFKPEEVEEWELTKLNHEHSRDQIDQVAREEREAERQRIVSILEGMKYENPIGEENFWNVGIDSAIQAIKNTPTSL